MANDRKGVAIKEGDTVTITGTVTVAGSDTNPIITVNVAAPEKGKYSPSFMCDGRSVEVVKPAPAPPSAPPPAPQA